MKQKCVKNEKLHSFIPKLMKKGLIICTVCNPFLWFSRMVKLSISFITVGKVIHSLKSWNLLKLRLRWHLSQGNANFTHPRVILTFPDNTSGGTCRSGHQHSPHATSYLPADFSTWRHNRSAGWVGGLLIIKQQDRSMPWDWPNVPMEMAEKKRQLKREMLVKLIRDVTLMMVWQGRAQWKDQEPSEVNMLKE